MVAARARITGLRGAVTPASPEQLCVAKKTRTSKLGTRIDTNSGSELAAPKQSSVSVSLVHEYSFDYAASNLS